MTPSLGNTTVATSNDDEVTTAGEIIAMHMRAQEHLSPFPDSPAMVVVGSWPDRIIYFFEKVVDLKHVKAKAPFVYIPDELSDQVIWAAVKALWPRACVYVLPGLTAASTCGICGEVTPYAEPDKHLKGCPGPLPPDSPARELKLAQVHLGRHAGLKGTPAEGGYGPAYAIGYKRGSAARATKLAAASA